MLTKNEIAAVNLSPTKKDFVQIWNELLDVAGKLSERWDPTSTNESDPGIVLLKALTGIADKLNYNIDKNTLEAFMPTAAQEESMRKLCDMLGYSMKYYRSATTDVTIRYYNHTPEADEYSLMKEGLEIPRFTVITDADKNVSYFTLNAVVISEESPSKTIPCMEGQLVQCESNNESNIITVNQIINNKYYLPEIQVAENGIFIYNAVLADTSYTLSEWEAVTNLNLYPRESKVFKFGYDSYEGRPYIEFPDDYSELFGEGVFIYFTRTNGVNGNISRSTLSQIELPTSGVWEKIDAEAFGAENIFAATNGSNSETITQAYNNFKKTVGTFETLVTCRDYMNKIYTLTEGNKALVSNVLVTDIRNDLNRAVCICSCDDAGIFYKEAALKEQQPLEYTITSTAHNSVEINKPIFVKYDTPILVPSDTGEEEALIGYWCLESAPSVKLFTNGEGSSVGFNASQDGFADIRTDSEGVSQWTIFQTDKQDNTIIFETGLLAKQDVDYELVQTRKDLVAVDAIDRFDIVLYPYKTYNKVSGSFADLRTPYDRSYEYSRAKINDIKLALDGANCKTLAHNIIAPDIGHITSINNYLKLNANIATNTKVSNDESLVIIDNIKKALANAFNLHELDFGEEIPFDSILNVIENADARIKVVSLNEPTLYTTYSVIEDYSLTTGEPEIAEYAVASKFLPSSFADTTDRFVYNNKSTFDTYEARKIHNKLAVRNVLAGRVPLFNYNNKFTSSFSESPYQTTVLVDEAALTGITDDDGHVPTADNNHTMWVSNGATFNGYFSGIDKNGNPIIEYTKTYTPTIYGLDPDLNPTADSLSSITQGVTGGAGEAALTSLSAYCTIAADGYQVQDGYVDTLVDSDGNTVIPAAFALNATDPSATANTTSSTPTIDDMMTAMAEGDDDALEAMQEQLDKSQEAAAIAAEAAYLAEQAQIDKITNVELSTGEFIKFRAPNFVTSVTYPAYVNYNLKLKTGVAAESQPAEAATLFSQFDADHDTWTPTNQNIRWQKVLNYFTALDAANGTSFKKKLVLSQTISKVVEAPEEGEEAQEAQAAQEAPAAPAKSPITVTVNNKTIKPDEESFEDRLNNSGCLKLLNPDFKAILEWDTSAGDVPPAGAVPLELALDISNPFITNAKVFSELQDSIDAAIQQAVEDESASLPTECAWKVIFEFEYVPIEPASLNAWETFIRYCGANVNNPASPCYNIFDFTPLEDNNAILFRTFEGGYEPGRMKTANSEKLLKFTKTYFNTIPDARTTGLYIIKSLGTDAVASNLANEEEYTLGDGEYLFIEYTPSSTAEDGSQQKSEPVTKVYEKGTVIRPKGFEDAIKDTASSNVSITKTVKFTTSNGSNIEVDMNSLGPNEQIEIREYAKTVFDKDTFELYAFKNFENCQELEKITGNNGCRSYTLKDGEYIFYTDKNKTDLAYFSTGTCVTLRGKSLIRGGDSSIDIASVFDGNLDESVWTHVSLTGDNDAVEFQEFQYVTLGPGDTLLNLNLVGAQHARCLNSTWQFCDNVKYTVAGDDTPQTLPVMHCADRPGNGWEASSILQLSVSPESAQTLRNTGKVKTSIVLGNVSTIGEGTNENAVVISPNMDGTDLSFKTNVACVSNGATVDIEDIKKIYKDQNIEGFELKAFEATEPAIVCTEPNKVIEITEDAALATIILAEAGDQADVEITDDTLDKAKSAASLIAALNDKGETVSKKSYVDFWNSIDLKDIQCGGYDANGVKRTVDRALSVPILLLPNTYGVCCFYVDYHSDSTDNKVWLEVAPGTQKESIKILNISNDENDKSWELPKDVDGKLIPNASMRLHLKPGINCLKVSTVNKIYIKASATAYGAVYFDELSLVNCDFTDSNGTVEPGSCEGLNIDQIGYVLNDKKAEYTQFAKKELQKAEVAATVAEIQAQLGKAQADASASLGVLHANSSRFEALVAGEQAALTDISSILASAEAGTNYGRDEYFVTLYNRNYKTDRFSSPVETLRCRDYISVNKNQYYCLRFYCSFLNRADISVQPFNFVKLVNNKGAKIELTRATYEYDDSYATAGYYLKPTDEAASTEPKTAVGTNGLKEYFYIFKTNSDTSLVNIFFNSYPGSTNKVHSIILDDVQINEIGSCVKIDEEGNEIECYTFNRDIESDDITNLVADGGFENGRVSDHWTVLTASGGAYSLNNNYYGNENLGDLVNAYQDVLSAKLRADDLLKEINSGSNEELEKQLAELLVSLNNKEESSKQLANVFDELTNIVNDKFDNLEPEQVVEAFTTDCSDYNFVINNARQCTTNKVFGEITITGKPTSSTTDKYIAIPGTGQMHGVYELLYNNIGSNNYNNIDYIIFTVPNSSDVTIDKDVELTITGNLVKCNGLLYLAAGVGTDAQGNATVNYTEPCLLNERSPLYYSDEKVTAVAAGYAEHVKAIKDKATENFENDFKKQLSDCLTELKALTSGDTNVELTTMLDQLTDELDAVDYPALKSYVLKLQELVEQDDLNTVISEMTLAAAGADYVQLYNALIKLRDILQSSDIKQLVVRVSETFEGKDYVAFNGLVEELETLLGNTSTIITDINTLIGTKDDPTTAKTVTNMLKATTPAVDTAIISAVNSISKRVTAEHNSSLVLIVSDLISEIEDIISSKLRTQIETVKETLKTSSDTKVTTLLEEVDILVSSYNTNLANVLNPLSSLPIDLDNLTKFAADAVVDIWPKQLKARWTSVIDDIIADVDAELDDLLYGAGVEEPSATGSKAKTLFSQYSDRVSALFTAELYAELSDSMVYEKFTNISRLLSDCRQTTGFTSLAYVLNDLLPGRFNNIIKKFNESVVNDQNVDTTNSTAYLVELLKEFQELGDKKLNGTSLAMKPQLLSEIRATLAQNIAQYNKLVQVAEKVLLPNISQLDFATYSNDEFFKPFVEKIENVKECFASRGISALTDYYSAFKLGDTMFDEQFYVLASATADLPSDIIAGAEDYLALLPEAVWNGAQELLQKSAQERADFSLLPEQILSDINKLAYSLTSIIYLKPAVTSLTTYKASEIDTLQTVLDVLINGTSDKDENHIDGFRDLARDLNITANANNTIYIQLLNQAAEYLEALVAELTAIYDTDPNDYTQTQSTAEATLRTELVARRAMEAQLLDELREIDSNRDFYYNVPIEFGSAVDFNDSEAINNTLMNPAYNYDCNNINNSFVVSKLDIDHLDKGIQIARTSKRS